MLRKILKALFVFFLSLVMSNCKSLDYIGDKGSNYQGDTSVAQVLRRQAQWNGAWASQNLLLLFELFSPDAQFASAGGKWTGKDDGLKKFSMLLKNRPDLQWVIRPKEVIINEDSEVAHTTGDWTEWWSEPDGLVTIRGTYVFIWKKTKNEPWLIHAAIFTPLSCIGQSQYCHPHKK